MKWIIDKKEFETMEEALEYIVSKLNTLEGGK